MPEHEPKQPMTVVCLAYVPEASANRILQEKVSDAVARCLEGVDPGVDGGEIVVSEVLVRFESPLDGKVVGGGDNGS